MLHSSAISWLVGDLIKRERSLWQHDQSVEVDGRPEGRLSSDDSHHEPLHLATHPQKPLATS